jgi:hypothetical protein
MPASAFVWNPIDLRIVCPTVATACTGRSLRRSHKIVDFASRH